MFSIFSAVYLHGHATSGLGMITGLLDLFTVGVVIMGVVSRPWDRLEGVATMVDSPMEEDFSNFSDLSTGLDVKCASQGYY